MAWHPTTLSREQQEERRLEGARLLREGVMSAAQIARHLGVSQVSVCRWKQRLAESNSRPSALKSTKAKGAAPRLSTAQWKQIKKMILAGAQAAGFSTERWTLARVQEAIEQRYKVRYTLAWLSIRLRQLGLSVQRPQAKARKREDQLAEAWLRQDWEAIKKSVTTWRRHHVR